jgi:hypothetical protein
VLTLVAITFGVIFFTAAIGAIPGAVITRAISGTSTHRGPVALGIAVGIGFAFSAIASAWSFGAIGASNYIYIVAGLFLLTLVLLKNSYVKNSLSVWKEFHKFDSFLLALPLLTAFLSKPYWDGIAKLKLAAGGGPDIPQNLMTVLSQPKIGSTWFEAKSNFLTLLGDKNLGEAIYHLYQLPSMQQQAGYDYLVYGTRWGLSIPFAQVLRIDPSLLVIGQATTISVGLAALGLIMYSFSRLVFVRFSLAYLLLVASVSSAPLVVQIFNGGMAQAWGLPGLALLSFTFLLTLMLKTKSQLTPTALKGLIALSCFGWLGNVVTYIDSSMTLAAVFIVSIVFLAFFTQRDLSISLFKTTFLGGLLAAIIVVPYTYAAISTMSIRLKLASGTGFLFDHWPLPSEMLGLLNIWTGEAGKARDPLILLLGIAFSLAIVVTVLRGIPSKNLWDRSVSLLGLSILLVCASIALWASQTSLGSNYSYVKVATYVAPIFLLIIGERMSENLHKGRAKNPKNDTPFALRMITPVFFIGIMILSVVSTNTGLSKKSEFSFPSSMTQILSNQEAQTELSKYNYLTTYRSLSNVLGFVGDVHWVSKAPNDQRLESRLDNEMRIICFAGDGICLPKTKELQVPSLNKFGIRVFESPISTSEFAALAPLDRYYAAMDAVGQARFEVPERFIGGNPLLKPNT